MLQDALKGFARIGFFVGGCGLLLLLIEPRNSPEYVLSLCSAIIGGVILLGVVILSRVFK